MTPIDPAKLKAAQRLQTASVASIAAARSSRPAEPVAARASEASAALGVSAATAGTEAPVDADRVATIRKAIDEGRYPVTPTRIADAMIAAGFVLRTPR